jgi:hypothetical protein
VTSAQNKNETFTPNFDAFEKVLLLLQVYLSLHTKRNTLTLTYHHHHHHDRQGNQRLRKYRRRIDSQSTSGSTSRGGD